jgi:histidyl-tRNA synthetase
MIVEAELISAVSEILQRLGFDDFVIRINHREVLRGILESAGIPSEKHTDALIALDKIDKIGREGVEKEFRNRGISDEVGVKLLTFFEFFIKEDSGKVFSEKQKLKIIELQKNLKVKDKFLKLLNTFLGKEEKELDANDLQFLSNYYIEEMGKFGKFQADLKNKEIASENESKSEFLIVTGNEKNVRFKDLLKLKSDYKKEKLPINFQTIKNFFLLLEIAYFIADYSDGITGLERLIKILEFSGEKANHLEIDPSLARGLSYYTGAIFEINVPDLAGSLGGGGRYDGLIGMFGKEQIPACGFSLGLERILVVMDERGMFPPELETSAADVMVAVWNEESAGESLKLANELRASGLRVLVYPEADKLGKQFKYDSQVGARFVCVVGDEELAAGRVTLKNMQTGEQETVSREDVAQKIKN